MSILTAIMSLGFISCGDKKITITYYMWGGNEDIAVVEQLAEEFNLLHPEWFVEVEPSSGDYYENLETKFGGGNAPDIFFTQGGEIESLVKDGLLLELDEYLANGENLKATDLWELNDYYRYNSTTKKMGSGKLYAIIKDLSPDFMMIYNKSHIDEYNNTHETTLKEEVGYPSDDGVYPSSNVAMSWAQSLKLCQLLTKRNGNMIVRYGTTLDQDPWVHLREWIQMGGDYLFTEDMSELNVGSQAVKNAIQHFVAFQSGETKSAEAVSAGGSTSGGEKFKNGDVSVVWNGRWAFQSYDWYDVNFDIGIAPPPTPNGGEDIYCATSMIAHAISATSAHPEVAYAFLDYYMTAGMKEYVKTGYNIPGNKTIAETDFVNVKDEYQKELNEYFLTYVKKATPITYNFYIDKGRVDGILGNYIPRIWADKNPISLVAALSACGADINPIIRAQLQG